MNPLSPPPLMQAGFSRRKLLAAAGFGGLLLGTGAWTFKALRGFGPTKSGLFVFDESEFEIVSSIAEAKFPKSNEWPMSAAEANVPAFVDLYVSELYDDVRSLFRTLVRGFDVATLPTHRSRFHDLDLSARQDVLKEWWHSPYKAKRSGYQALMFPIHMGYFENDAVEKALGLTVGCQLDDLATRPTLWTMKGKV
jgi:hypothetical protein